MTVQVETLPEWRQYLLEMEFCHIDDGSEQRSFCGAAGGPITCDVEYDGEAICPSCGLPICPRCAQLEDLACALEDA